MRDIQLKDKAEEIRMELEIWAKKNSILNPGEQIIFAITIGHTPTVVSDPKHHKPPREQSLEKFLTIERLMACGAPHTIASRIRSQVLIANDLYNCKNVGEFLDRFDSEEHLLRIHNIGRMSVSYLVKALDQVY